jgi:hypothetical protein
MIFTLCILAVYVGFHNHVNVRNSVVTVMLSIFFLYSILAITPCYTQDKYSFYRLIFFCFVIFLCFLLAISWVFIYSTKQEASLFALPIALSFLYLGIGFWFYLKKYPEKMFRKNKFV